LGLGGACVLATTDAAAPSAWARAATGAALIALALLAHGGVAFSLATLPVLPALNGGVRRWFSANGIGSLTAATGIAVLLLAPWIVFQRVVAPPGDRLLRMHLAGVDAMDPRPLSVLIVDQYRARTARELIDTRAANLREQWLRPVHGRPWAAWIQWQQFFHVIPGLGVLVAGLATVTWGALRRAGGGGIRLERALLAHALATWWFWIAVMFPAASALVHHGSYTMMLTLLALGAIGLERLRVWGTLLLGVHLAVFGSAWIAPAGIRLATPRPAWLAAGCVALLAFGLVACLAPLDEPGDRA
jgi:hypothetical protein